jgi:hypothetical protein
MNAPIKARRVFVDNFNVVVQFYRCDPEEVEIMKAVARKDMPGAEEAFAKMAAEVRAAIPLDQSGAIAAEVNRQRRGR